MPDPFRCASAAEARREDVAGTASRIDRWLLVEAPGPWGARALPQSRGVADAALLPLQQRAKAAHARTLLVRRPGDGVPSGDRRQVFVADSRPGHERLLTTVVRLGELASLELPYEGPAVGWEPVAALVGVCTHGTHDVCCALRGRPVAAALARTHPDLTWEISHVGGDRFAANALVLPGGHYLGQLTAEGAPDVVDRLLAGERPDPCYRGRSCWPMPVQAALALAGVRLGLTALDALTPGGATRLPDGSWQVELASAAGAYAAVLAQEQGPDTSRLTCHAPDPLPVPRWRLIDLR